MLLSTPQNIAGNSSLWRCEIADGITHRKYLNLGWIGVLPLSFYVSGYLYQFGYSFILSEIFCIYNYSLCRIIDPDSDHLSITVSESSGSRFFERIPILGGIFKAVWLAYTTLYAGIMLIFGGHRNFLSHSLIISTIGRMIYFNIPCFLLMRWIYFQYYPDWDIDIFWNMYNMGTWAIPYFSTQFIFMSIGDGIHLLLDTEIVKGILYVPVTANSKKNAGDFFKPRYGKFIVAILKVILGYSYSKIEGIKNLRKR